MRKGICVYCSSLLDISDDIVECAVCTAVMRVVGWNPVGLELLEPGVVDTGRIKPITEQELNKYVTGGRRFLAGIVDGMVLLPIGLIGIWAIDPDRPPALIAVWLLVSFSAGWAYSVFMHGLYGQTIGKMAGGVKVLDISERPITMRQAFLRDSVIIVISTASLMVSLYLALSGSEINLLAGSEINLFSFAIMQLVIDFAEFAWFMAELLTMLTNEKRRAIHDFIAGTVVVRVSSQSQAQDIA